MVIVPGRPDAPTDLQAVSAAGSLVLTWNPSAWDGGSPVTNHLIEVSSDGGMSWEVVGGDVGRGTTATVSDLENGTTYLLRVRAVSGLGSSRATTVQARAGHHARDAHRRHGGWWRGTLDPRLDSTGKRWEGNHRGMDRTGTGRRWWLAVVRCWTVDDLGQHRWSRAGSGI